MPKFCKTNIQFNPTLLPPSPAHVICSTSLTKIIAARFFSAKSSLQIIFPV